MRSKTPLLLLVGVLALIGGVWLGQWLTTWLRPTPAPTIAGIYFNEPQPVVEFRLTQGDGQPFSRQDLQGRWSFLYFGYTYCPDVCPLALVELNKLAQRLVQRGIAQDTAYWLISVDPERDTPPRLREYAAYFNPQFRGATGAREELDKLARQFGVAYQIPPHQPGESYAVDHSSTVILIDPEVRLRAVFTPPHQPATLAADFGKIRERYQAER